MQIFTIKPIKPTCFGDQEFYELRPSDHFLTFSVDTIHVFPGAIIVEQFNSALSRALSVYPLFAGSLHRSYLRGSSWKIRLTDRGVLVKFQDVSTDSEQGSPAGAVVQRPLRYIERVDVKNIAEGSSDEALVRILITRHNTTGETTIGMSLSHILGDAHTVTRFQRLISHYYQGIDPLDPAPSYLPFAECKTSETVPDIAQLRNPYPIGAPPRYSTDSAGGLPVPTIVRLTLGQIHALHKSLSNTSQGSSCRISRQDSFSALIVYSISQADDDPIKCIVNTVDHRGKGVADENLAGNVLISTCTEAIELGKDDSTEECVAKIAVYIRNSIDYARDPDCLGAQVLKTGVHLLQSAFDKMQYDFAPPQGQVTINSTWKSGWQSADFGYSGKVAFHTTNHVASRYIKVFTPNPVLLPGGTWKDRSGDAEISFALFESVKSKFVATIQQVAKEVGIVDDIEVI